MRSAKCEVLALIPRPQSPVPSAMNTSLVVDGTHLRTTLDAPLAARLFGLPFLLVGGYLAYQLAGGVADLVAGRAAIGEAPRTFAETP